MNSTGLPVAIKQQEQRILAQQFQCRKDCSHLSYSLQHLPTHVLIMFSCNILEIDWASGGRPQWEIFASILAKTLIFSEKFCSTLQKYKNIPIPRFSVEAKLVGDGKSFIASNFQGLAVWSCYNLLPQNMKIIEIN